MTFTHPFLLTAWKVNFNMSIASFEVDIQGARNFVDLALNSPYTQPPSIIFVSSIGVFSSAYSCTLTPTSPAVRTNAIHRLQLPLSRTGGISQ